MSEMCENCAFRKTCETWREPHNRAVSQICAAGPVVFFCHEGIDWKDPLMHVTPTKVLAQITDGRLRVCEGWRRSVAARTWPTDSALRWYQRQLAKQALVSLGRFEQGELSARQFQKDLTVLDRYYRGPRAWQIARMRERANV
jgi:hypothetical protein